MQTIKHVFISMMVGFLTLGIVNLIYAWTGPTEAPPEGNVAAPINVGDITQYKSGALGIGGVLRGYSNVIFDGAVTLNALKSCSGRLYTDASGNILCGTGGTGVTQLNQGTGITLSPNPITNTGTISADTTYLQRRVSGTCVAGSSIRVIATDGTVTCETDDVGAGGLPSGTSGQTLRHDGTNWVANSVIYNNGTNVGIGTASPQGKLHIFNADVSMIRIESTNSNAGMAFFKNNVYRGAIFSTSGASDGLVVKTGDDSGPIRLQTGQADRVWINSAGNVGIGTTNPSQKLEVNGTAQAATFYASTGVSTYDTTVSAGTIETSQICLGNGTNCITSWSTGGYWTLSGTNIYNSNTGNVGIGTQTPSAKLDVEGGNILLGGNLAVKGNADIDYNVNVGKTITLSPSDSTIILRPVNVGESTYVPEPPEYVGATPGTDTCNANTNDFYWCNGITAGAACTDYGRIGGGGPYYRRTVTCAVQSGNYTVKNDYNSLKFINGVGEAKVTIGQDGNVGIGTTNPTSKLYVKGSSGTSGAISIDTNGQSQLEFLKDGVQKWAVAASSISGTDIIGIYNFPTASIPFLVTSTGNVGIGTVSPGAKLEIYGGGDILLKDDANDPGDLIFQNSVGTEYGRIYTGDPGTGVIMALRANSARVADIAIRQSNGNVGIGTAGPQASLHVGGTFGAIGAMSTKLTTNAGSLGTTATNELVLASIGFQAGNNEWLGIRAYRTANGSDWTTTAIGLEMDVDNSPRVNNAAIWLNSNGNVGIGTVSPSYKLQIAGEVNIDNGIYDADYRIKGKRSIGYYGGWNANMLYINGYSDWTSGTQVRGSGLYVDGNVGIGTTNPSFGKVQIESPSVPLAFRETDQSGIASLYRIALDRKSLRFDVSLDPNGTSFSPYYSPLSITRYGIGIGGPEGTNVTNVLTVQVGSPTDPIADAWTTYSSRRWKENIQSIEGALNKVLQLKGVYFDWKANGQHDIGMIAEEVGKVIPEVVVYEENGTDAKSLDYARLVTILIEAIKEQQKQIDELKTEVNLLKK